MILLERIKYGREVGVAKGKNLSGTMYAIYGGIFSKDYLSPSWPDNWREINFIIYIYLKIWYFIIENFFKSYYRKIERESWK